MHSVNKRKGQRTREHENPITRSETQLSLGGRDDKRVTIMYALLDCTLHVGEHQSSCTSHGIDEHRQSIQTFVHLLGTRSNVPIILRLDSCAIETFCNNLQ